MKLLKKIFLISSLLILSFCFSTFANSIDLPNATSYKYVNDYTNTLSKNSIDKIVSIGSELEKKTSAQCVVVIIDSTNDFTIEEYANKLFRTWGIGTADKNNGLLILLAKNDKRWRVEVGKGLEGAIPDALSNKIMTSYGKPYFAKGNYDEGILDTYYKFSTEIANEYGISLTSAENINISSDNVNPNKSKTSKGGLIAPGFILLLLFFDFIFNRGRITRTLLTLLFLSNHNRHNGPRGGGGNGGFGGFGGGGHGGFGGGSSNGGGSSGSW